MVTYLRKNIFDLSVLIISTILFVYMMFLRPGMDNIIDLLNYHAFNGWALLNGEWGNHFHPGFVHHYYLNWQDVFHWMLLDSFNAEIVVTILSVIHLSVAVPVYLISREFSGVTKMRALSIAVLSLNTIYFLPHVGDFNGDIISFIPMAYAVWLLLVYMRTFETKTLLGSGLLTGLSLSLKLTNAIYAPIFIVFIIFLLVKRKYKHIFLLSATTVASFVLVSLPLWLTILKDSGTNPIFPLYNNIFRSPRAPEIAFDAPHYRLPLEFFNIYFQSFFIQISKQDFRPNLLFATIIIMLILTVVAIVTRKFFKKTTFAINPVLTPALISILLGFIIHALQFGVGRYTVGLWILTTPFIMVSLWEVAKIVKNPQHQLLLYGVTALTISSLLFFTLSPTTNRAYTVVSGEKFFIAETIPELEKYDAIILTVPSVATWLPVIHREHIKQTGQLWLSTAFNREDAKVAEEMLKDKTTIGYITWGGENNFAEKNLNTLGYTNGGNCVKIGITKYGPPYNNMHICETIYTGEYSYTLNNLEDKMYGGGEAALNIPVEELYEVFFPFRKN